MRKNILFDLDSTLLQMDQDEFIRQYIYTLNLKIKEIGKDKEFINYFLKSVYCTIENNGDKTNEDLFWSLLDLKYPNSRQYEPFFDSFYKNEFRNISSIVDKNNTTKLLIDALKGRGYNLILATQPIYPLAATLERMSWCGLKKDDFSYITSYENSHYCKPNKKYYEEILANLNLDSKDCVMIGNDMDDDFKELPVEIDRIIILDYLINTNNKEINFKKLYLNDLLNEIIND